MKLSPRLKLIIALVLIVILFVILNLTTFLKEIKNSFYSISSPIQRTFWETGKSASDFFEGLFKTKILQGENESLILQNQELLAENLFLKELKKENETLRIALKIGLEKDLRLILAKVISKDISQDSILIDKGIKDGISKNLPVITSQKVLLGRIGQVFDNFSEVILISNKESAFDAKVSEREIYGVVKGKGNLGLYLDLIPKEGEVSEGDFVVTSALGGIFPSGLLVGAIKKVEKSDIEPWQTAEIKSSFQLKDLDNLFIIEF